MSKKDGWDELNVFLGIVASGITIYQAFKKCPCDGNPLPFKAHCNQCGHNHYF